MVGYILDTRIIQRKMFTAEQKVSLKLAKKCMSYKGKKRGRN